MIISSGDGNNDSGGARPTGAALLRPRPRFRIREPWASARTRQRCREFGGLFKDVPPSVFGDGLEIGGGDGFVASLVAPHCRSFLTTDSFAREPASGTAHVTRLVCDASQMPFPSKSFDFIFSSSVLEHICDRAPTYHELSRCLRSGGLMVHVMPSRTWKLLQLIFYYPHLVIGGIDLLADALLRPRPPSTREHAYKRWNDHEVLPPLRRILRGVVPQVHGEYANHLAEWRGFSMHAWTKEFTAAGFDVCGVIPMPLYSGYGFGLDRLRRWGERRKLASHYAFLLALRGDKPTALPWLSLDRDGAPKPAAGAATAGAATG